MSAIKLPAWNKTTKNIAAGALVLLLVIFAWTLWYKLRDKMRARAEANKLAGEIDEEALSHPLNQYKIFAEKLQGAMNGVGTDENAIYTVFKQMVNNSDVLQTVKSFGDFKEKTLTGISFQSGTLPQWLATELSETELSRVNEILKAKDITIQF